jgi:hypothetical protein
VRECPPHSNGNASAGGKSPKDEDNPMNRITCSNQFGWNRLALWTVSLGLVVLLAALTPATAQTLTQISTDTFTNTSSQHATEVEPHVLTNGTTAVATFQMGRFGPAGGGGGASDIGWATSTDGGESWSHGNLPGVTNIDGTGPYDRASDPAVAFDAAHNVWMIASLPISNTSQTPAVIVSRSLDGGFTWQNPVSVDPTSSNSDKNWIACDTSATSSFFGHCYVEWDNPLAGDEMFMSTSTDGGVSWGSAIATANRSAGVGGQPLVQPNGTVVVPIESVSGSIVAFTSTDGGTTWSKPVTISNIQVHTDAGGIRSGPLPSAAMDGSGVIYVVWEDCRFRASCSTNDLVFSTSTDGVHWTKVARIPIDAISSTVDHFIPGIGIDPATSGASAHVAIHYYFYPKSNCTQSSCRLYVGYISSHNAGRTWNRPVTLAGPMQLTWLPNTQNGLMVGDYIATAFNNGIPHGVFAVAAAKSGTVFNEATYTAQGLTVAEEGPQLSSAHDRPLHNLSDPIEHERPEKGVPPPSRRAAKRSARK